MKYHITYTNRVPYACLITVCYRVLEPFDEPLQRGKTMNPTMHCESVAPIRYLTGRSAPRDRPLTQVNYGGG